MARLTGGPLRLEELWARAERDLESLFPEGIPAGLRGLVEQAGLVDAVLGSAPGAYAGFRDYLKEVSTWVGTGGGSASSARTATPRMPRAGRDSAGTVYEKERLQLRSDFLAKLATPPMSQLDPKGLMDPFGIRRFRSDSLGNTLLSKVNAERLLDSAAPRFLSLDAFRRRGIPLTAHRSRILGYEPKSSSEGEWFCVERRVTLEISWRRKRVRSEFGYAWRHRRGASPPTAPTLPLPVADGRIERLGLFPGSVFATLQDVAAKVASACRWDLYSAVQFVLSGVAPEERGIQCHVHPHWGTTIAKGTFPAGDVIVLEVEPWLSYKTVAAAYRVLQRRVLGGRSRAHDTSLDLVKLAVEVMGPGESLPDARRLMDTWNSRYPKRKYRELWRFRDGYAHALMAILYPARDRRSVRPQESRPRPGTTPR
jgi:hypothetical protein